MASKLPVLCFNNRESESNDLIQIDHQNNNQNNGNKNRTVAIKSLLAGGIAGSVAKTVIGPFDRVKILFQVGSPVTLSYQGKIIGVFQAIKYVYKNHGIYGLYRGHSAMLLRIFPYSGINYMAFEQYKKLLMPTQESQSSLKRLISGSLAGATAVLFTYPFDIMRARLAYDLSVSQHSNKTDNLPAFSTLRHVFFGLPGKPSSKRLGWLQTIKGLIYSDVNYHPMRNLYRGFIPTVFGIMPYAGVSFFTFETLKGSAVEYKLAPDMNHVPVGWKFLFGLTAGALGQTAAYPLDVIRRRMQLYKMASHLPEYPTIRSAITHILQTRGLKGFFTGLSINYLKVAPSSAISFVTYEWVKQHIMHV